MEVFVFVSQSKERERERAVEESERDALGTSNEDVDETFQFIAQFIFPSDTGKVGSVAGPRGSTTSRSAMATVTLPVGTQFVHEFCRSSSK